MLIGALLVGMAVFMLREAKGLLVGEGASPDVVHDLEAIARPDAAVQHLHAPLTMYLGLQDALLTLKVEFQKALTADEVEQAIERLQLAIQARHPDFKRIFVEAQAVSSSRRRAQKVAGPLA